MVVRLSEVGLIGEKGTKVPNASIAEISLELELSLTFTFDYSRSVSKPANFLLVVHVPCLDMC